MALTLMQAQTALDAWIAADLAVARGQSYSMNGRSLTLANTREIREQIQYWERRVATMQSANQNQQAALADFSDV
jgi:hypothetical protein